MTGKVECMRRLGIEDNTPLLAESYKFLVYMSSKFGTEELAFPVRPTNG